jgi:hypothetical protein
LDFLTPVSAVPPWNVVLAGAKTYLQFCDCQPLPLFHRPTFLQTLQYRDPEVLFSVLALAVRFENTDRFDSAGHTEAARTRVSKRVFEGKVELSTIQTLCLLTLIDFAGMEFCVMASFVDNFQTETQEEPASIVAWL